MRFTCAGTIEGQPAVLVYEDGVLSGSAAKAVKERVADPEPVGATPTGPFYQPQADPPVLLLVIEDVFDLPYELSGDEPPRVPVPDVSPDSKY